ncbi:hypothetical protein BaRGS_00003145 [Batillaria attramentaria]|uniref:Peptidase S1 domain-containing protein n=1 Tax=Batillaria attramentaria TaxID=370345 RepID=A0ABD0M247_9CAEN
MALLRTGVTAILLLWTTYAAAQSFLGPNAGICESQGGQCQNRLTGCGAGYQPASDYYANSPFVCGFNFICCVPNTQPVDDNCGQRLPVSESRILNGIPSSLCDWPFVVSIRSLKTGFAPPLTFSNTDPSCSGVILNREWVLTHALCCYIQDSTPDQAASNLVVVAGEYNVLQADVDPATGQRAEQLLRVSRCYVHPSYVLDGQDTLDSVDVNNDMQTNSNGLALIRLADPVQQSNCASQACLPSATPLRNTGCDTYNNCVFLGWGYSAADYSVLDPRLSYGRTTIYRDSVCDYMAQSVYPTKPRPEGSACTSPRDGTGVCVGDQGGPVLCYDGDRWAVQGILPFRWCEDDAPHPWVVDVAAYEEWIQTTMANP